MAKNRRTDGVDRRNTLWFKDAIIYELHVRAFCDSNGDGVGDFEGLTQKLDYLQDLGVTAIWLLPFYPSPWRDDGYDISDYCSVHPAYGSLRDFQAFLSEAHTRGLRVITELVLNHTSDQCEWFQRSRRAPVSSQWRDFYVWADTPDKYSDARIIFKDFEASNWTWDPVAKAYYWHRFYSHQPDLNYDNPRVREAVTRAVDFWLRIGVDGLRLDAVPYLYEREGTSCENLPETHAFLKQLRHHLDAKYTDRMLLAEANQWPEDAVAYFGQGDECHMAFHFPLMPRLFMALRREDRFPIVDILDQTPAIPETCQWALFLRNHDELTLEMVTDEERDYMYRVYAHDPQMRINLGIRRRLGPLLGNNRRYIELLNLLLFCLPGTPVVYYGDEIGMGDNVYVGDRNGVRTPMQWSADRNAGFSRANPQRLYLPVIIDPEYHYEAVNVEAQQSNRHSLFWWMKRLIALRKHSRALSRGTIDFLYPSNRRVLAFLRRHGDDCVLVVANLSRFSQPVELELPGLSGMTPIEVFGRVAFPPIQNSPCFLTLAPHGVYLFTLERGEAGRISTSPETLPELPVSSWESVLATETRSALGRFLPTFLKDRRWFRSKARTIRTATLSEVAALVPEECWLATVQVEYNEGEAETYLLPLAVATGEGSQAVLAERADEVVTRLRGSDGQVGVLHNAVWSRGFRDRLLEAIRLRKTFRGENGKFSAVPSKRFGDLLGPTEGPLESRIQKAEQSNRSIFYGDRAILKLFCRLEPGLNPDLEIGRFLTEQVGFPHVAPVAGFIEYRPNGGEAMTVGILQGYVPNEGDAWEFTLDSLGRYFERALAQGGDRQSPPVFGGHPLELAETDLPPEAQVLIPRYLQDVRLLGQRTAELHLALCQSSNPSFVPEPLTEFYRHSLYHSMIGLTNQSFQLLRSSLKNLPEVSQKEARLVLERANEVRSRFRSLRDSRMTAMRTRNHGDYHLGQVLFTGKDFVIIDFEGEPARPLSERRIKRSPLRDVAGMLRSFHYASEAALVGQVPGVIPDTQLQPVVESWAGLWYLWVSASFLKGYFATAGAAPFLPRSRDQLRVLVDSFLLQKAVYEVGYELNNRPDWVRIPLRGILQLLDGGGTPGA